MPLNEEGAGLPAWAGLIYHFTGRWGLSALFASAGFVSFCFAIHPRWPGVATSMLVTAAVSLVVLIPGFLWWKGYFGLLAFFAWALLCFLSLMAPTPTARKVLFGIAYFSGPVVSLSYGIYAGAATWIILAIVFFLFGIWVATAKKSAPDEKESDINGP